LLIFLGHGTQGEKWGSAGSEVGSLLTRYSVAILLEMG
jgi:hypothetical protein